MYSRTELCYSIQPSWLKTVQHFQLFQILYTVFVSRYNEWTQYSTWIPIFNNLKAFYTSYLQFRPSCNPFFLTCLYFFPHQHKQIKKENKDLIMTASMSQVDALIPRTLGQLVMPLHQCIS